jgi:hypothetical protein
MAVKREELEVRDITDINKNIIGLFRDSYIVWFELTTSLWEQNLKMVSSQLNMWLSLQSSYVNTMRDTSQRSPNEGTRVWNEGLKPLNAQADWFVSLQRDYVESTRAASDKVTKDLLSLSQKSMETMLSIFDDYLNLYRW